MALDNYIKYGLCLCNIILLYLCANLLMMFELLFRVFSNISFAWVIDRSYFPNIDNDFSLVKYAVG